MAKSPEEKEKIVNNKIAALNKSLNNLSLSPSLTSNIKTIKNLFTNDDAFITREFNNQDNDLHFFIAYCDGLVNSYIINENIIKPLMLCKNSLSYDDKIDYLTKNVIIINQVKKATSFTDIINDVTYGDVVLFIDGISIALILNAKNFDKRSITEPESEKIISGPREGFNESLLTNISLIRRKLRTNHLKFIYSSIGDLSNTKICLCYIDKVVNKDALAEVKKRLAKIHIDAVLDANYISELIGDNHFSPFKSAGYTERPDVIVGNLLEGRVAIMIDGTPVVLTVPYLFIENFQSSEDYYFSFFYSTFTRMIRIIGFLFAIIVPAFYIAIVAYHKEMLPTPLFISIAVERSSAPLPAAVEAFILLIVFDILKEAGVRMPSNIGQALSIVGAIVIGQALVAARLVAAPMVVVVAFTGITSLLVPKLSAAVIDARVLLLVFASTLGLFGFVIGLSIIIIHIFNLKSFTVEEVSLNLNFKFQEYKDKLMKAPTWMMTKRPKSLSNNMTRLRDNGS